ncbi:MAG: NAD(P)-binding domain-containing protein [Phycisphaerales bacterium]
MTETTEVALIGAGPIGLEVAAALRQDGVDYLHLDAGRVGETIYNFPPELRFFSSAERIAIAGVPIQTVDQTKLTREQYLAYLRVVAMEHNLPVRTFERVTSARRDESGEGFTLETDRFGRRSTIRARRVVLATGGTTTPRTIGIPGEDLPHVSHRFEDPHTYFGRRVCIVGGKNSAVEAALRCYHAGVRVTIAYRRAEFPKSVKYWLRPEIDMLIETGRVTGHFNATPTRITPTAVTFERTNGDGEREPFEVETDFVLLMTGWNADMTLARMLGVHLKGEGERPEYDERTMETNTPGVYIVGTATAGTQSRYAVFLENCHVHVSRLVAALQGRPLDADDAEPPTYPLPES